MLGEIKSIFHELFNWKQNPSSVFYFAVPLAVIGIGCVILYAVLHAINGNYGYLITLVLMSPVIAIAVATIMRLVRVYRKYTQC